MKKKSIAVLYGGQSGEHEVSLISASSVISHLDRERYDIIPIGISHTGQYRRNNLAAVDPLQGKTLQVEGEGAVHFSLDRLLQDRQAIDVVFPVLHGTYGEDGCLQGYLELANTAYVGSGVLGSALSMDKDVTKRLAQAAALPITPYRVVRQSDWLCDSASILKSLLSALPFPLFVKPANTGSSVGISKVKTEAALLEAIAKAFQYDTKIIIEQGYQVREVELAVLENSVYGQPPLVSVPGEIKTTHEFYSYEAKYCDEDSLTLEIPAQVSDLQLALLKQMAQQVFVLMECSGMARVDFFINQENNQIIFNELNTIPGFTHVSMYPMMWQKSGLSYPDLLTHLIELALAKQARKQQLKRDF